MRDIRTEMICAVCREKNYSPALEQLKNIESYLHRNKPTENKTENSMIRNKYENILKEAFTNSTRQHCKYGLNCSKLSQMEIMANTIVYKMIDELLCFVETANEQKLYGLLRLTQGYFPQAYVRIERYWQELRKGKKTKEMNTTCKEDGV